MKQKSKSIYTYLGLFISLFGITLLSSLLKGIDLFGSSYGGKINFSNLQKWILVLFLVLIIKFLEKRKITSIGFKSIQIKTILKGVMMGLLAVVVSILTLGLLFNLFGLEEPSTLGAVSQLPIILQLVTITTAAITEEIFYRGYAIERLGELTGKYLLGGIISGIIFVAIHFPAWGIAGAIPQIIFTIFITVFYLKKRDLTAAIAMHWTINFLMIIVLPALM